jgi:predicted esterase
MRASYTSLLRAGHDRSLVRACFVAAIAVGCSSGANDNGQQPSGEGGYGTGSFGGTNGAGGSAPFTSGGSAGTANPPPATCGNGAVDPGEDCDGAATQTCAAATLGALPIGSVSCKACHLDTSGCSSGNPGGSGTGGGIGAGGGTNIGGNTNVGGSTNIGNGGTTQTSGGDAPSTLPSPKEACQPFVTGDMTFLGSKVKIWAGAPSGHGPLVFYWYATFSSVAEVTSGLGQAAINDITSQGGVVAAMYTTTGQGQNTGDNVWYTGDFDVADEIVACAVQEQQIDTRRIHATGFSAGGLQSGYMAYARSSYIASVVTYSGGSFLSTLQDPTNTPAIMCQHGDSGSDVVVIDFAKASAATEADIKSKGGFAVDCNHGGGHLIPAADVGATWQFLKDHPFNATPEPYAGGLPAGFPSYCTIVQ